ncbi:hypothetical protein MKW94_015828, partial [Papaver nudicaule]|nr:hypothetical protein [Papaver nudicaule]
EGILAVNEMSKWWHFAVKLRSLSSEISCERAGFFSLYLVHGDSGMTMILLIFTSPHFNICQIAEQNPNALIFKVNYEDLKPMCYSLNIHVLPFFRFYRGAEGRLCSFSCTNATMKKFKDALAKHGTERCSLGPAKGLEEKELLKLAEIKEIDFSTSSSSRSRVNETMEELVLSKMGFAG